MPAEQTTTTAAPHKTTAPPATRTTGGNVKPGGNSTVSGRTTATARNNSRSITATLTASATSLTPTPTISPTDAGGMSGAAIGGMAAGGAALFAIVGLLFYKRRKRSAVGDSSAAAKGAKGGKTDAEAMVELGGGGYSSINKDISGPMALAPAKGIDSAPAHRPEAQFREQQQFRPGMRDELFAQPGSALHGTMSKGPSSPGADGNASSPVRPPAPVSHQNSDQGNQVNRADQANHQGNNNNPDARPPLQKQNSHPGSEGYYDDTHAKPARGPDSPRSSYSSDGGESAYLTLEQAQQAHNHKMMGHKESISSVDMLLERSSPGANAQYQQNLNQSQSQAYGGYQGNNNNSSNHLAPPSARGPPPPMSPDPYAESAYSDYPDDRTMSPGIGPTGGYHAPPSPYGQQQQQQQQQGGYYNGNGANKQQQPMQMQRDSDYNQGPYGRF
ncbi:hypothetical protein BGZ95_010964 [Linnemannia exigua]|uniref:Uncharacterized protein n=1 Tax=Linnemannia exigua TaxID=604196 RepID=A0AAD4H600_9FUNG|nr:hypothetical protein BGZ95_010964 [Linnemannia exigua]